MLGDLGDAGDRLWRETLGTGSGDRLRCGNGLVGKGLGLACAGSGLRSQEGAGGWGFRAAREEIGVFAFNARSGPVPLALWGT